MIGRGSGARFFNQSQRVAMQSQSICRITFDTQLKTALFCQFSLLLIPLDNPYRLAWYKRKALKRGYQRSYQNSNTDQSLPGQFHTCLQHLSNPVELYRKNMCTVLPTKVCTENQVAFEVTLHYVYQLKILIQLLYLINVYFKDILPSFQFNSTVHFFKIRLLIIKTTFISRYSE